MPNIEVYCTITNCDYWGKDNHCFAEKILITHDATGAAWPDRVDAPDGKNLEATPADTCMATCCKTFRPKDSHKGPVPELLPHEAYVKNKPGGNMPAWQPTKGSSLQPQP